MGKYRAGDIIEYNGRQLRVRQEAFVGFECDRAKGAQLYDLTDINTGEHLSIPKQEIDKGIKEVDSINIDEDQFQTEQVKRAKFVKHSKQSYWNQMKNKINVTEEQKTRFDAAVKNQKKVDSFNDNSEEVELKSEPSTLRKLWNKVISLGKDQ